MTSLQYCMPHQSKMRVHKTQPKDGETMDDVARTCTVSYLYRLVPVPERFFGRKKGTYY
jgi:hypothetical protein